MLSNLIVDYSGTLVISTTLFLSILLFMTFYFKLYTQSDQNLRDYLVWDSPLTLDFDKNVAAAQEINRLQFGHSEKDNIHERSIEMNTWNAMILYHSLKKEENIWTPHFLGAIKEME